MQRLPILHDELELPEQLGAPWRVVEIYVEEALDNPYRALVKAVANPSVEVDTAELDTLLGCDAVLRLIRRDPRRGSLDTDDLRGLHAPRLSRSRRRSQSCASTSRPRGRQDALHDRPHREGQQRSWQDGGTVMMPAAGTVTLELIGSALVVK